MNLFLIKSVVRAHTAKNPGGAGVHLVKEHNDRRTKKAETPKGVEVWSNWGAGETGKGVSRWHAKEEADAARKFFEKNAKKAGQKIETRLEPGKGEGWGFSYRSQSVVKYSVKAPAPAPQQKVAPVSTKPEAPKMKPVAREEAERGKREIEAKEAGNPRFHRTPIELGTEVIAMLDAGKRHWRGNVIKIDENDVLTVMGKRRADGSRTTFTVPRNHAMAWKDWQALKTAPVNKKMKAAEGGKEQRQLANTEAGAEGQSVVLRADVSKERKRLVEEKLGMSEGKVFESPRMIGYLKAMAARYQRDSRLPYDEYDGLWSEATMSMMGELRRRIPVASKEQVAEFVEHLQGKRDTSDIWNLAGNGVKGRLNDYVKEYRDRVGHEINWDIQGGAEDMGEAVGAELNTYLERHHLDKISTAPAQERVIFHSEETLPTLVENFVTQLPKQEEEVVRYRHNIKRAAGKPNMTFTEVAAALNAKTDVPKLVDEAGKPQVWERHRAGKVYVSGIQRLRDMKGIDALRAFHKSQQEQLGLLAKAQRTLTSVGRLIADKLLGLAPETQPTLEDFAKSINADYEVLAMERGDAVWVKDDDFEKSFSSELQAKYPGGHWITVTQGPLDGRHIFIVPHTDGKASVMVGGGPAMMHKVLSLRRETKKPPEAGGAEAGEYHHEAPKAEAKPELTEERKQELLARKKEIDEKIARNRQGMADVLRERTGVELGVTPKEQAKIEADISGIVEPKAKATERLRRTNELKREKDKKLEEMIAETKKGLLLGLPQPGVSDSSPGTAVVDEAGAQTLYSAVKANYEDLLNQFYEIQALKKEANAVNKVLHTGKDRAHFFSAVNFKPMSADDLAKIILDEKVRDDDLAAHYKLMTSSRGWIDQATKVKHKPNYASKQGDYILHGGFEALTAIVGEATGHNILTSAQYEVMGPANAATLARHFVETTSEDPAAAVKGLKDYLEKSGNKIASGAVAEGDRFLDMANRIVGYAKDEHSLMSAAQAHGTQLTYMYRAYEAYGQAEGALSQAAELVYAFADKPQPVKFTAKTIPTLEARMHELKLNSSDVQIMRDPESDGHMMVVKEKAYKKLLRPRPVAGSGMAVTKDGIDFSADDIKALKANTGDLVAHSPMLNEYFPAQGGVAQKNTPSPEQEAAARLVAKQKRVYLDFPPGMGKSGTVMYIKAHLDALAGREGKSGHKMLVAMPKSTISNFADEVRKFTKYNVVIIPGGEMAPAKRAKLMAEAGPNDIVLVNHATFRTSGSAIRDAGFGIVVADEAHEITQRENAKGSMQSKGLEEAVGGSEYYIPMSGTPVPSDLSQAYFHAHAMNPERFDSQKEFMARYGTAHRGAGMKEKVGVMLKREMGDNWYSVPKALTHNMDITTHIVPLTNWQKDEYRKTQDAAQAKKIDPLQRGRQHNETLNMAPAETNGKFAEMGKIIDHHLATAGSKKEKVIIYAQNRKSWGNIRAYLNEKYPGMGIVDFTGDQSGKKGAFAKAKDSFANDDGIQFAIVSDAGVKGLNLQYTGKRGGATRAIAFASGANSWTTMDQFLGRANRTGAAKDVHGHLLLSDTPHDLGTEVRWQDKKNVAKLIQSPSTQKIEEKRA